LLGVGLASLALIKINVGVFALVATGFGFAASAPALARYRAVLLAAGAAIVAAPLALMWPAMDQPWARGYALHVAAAALGVVIALLSLGPDETLRPAQLAWWAAGAGGLALVVCGAVLLRGTRPADLFDAVLVRPFGQAAALTIPMRIPSQGKAIALVGLGLCVGAAIRSNRGGRGASLIEGLLRLGAGLAIAITAAGLSPTTGLFTHTPPGLLMAPLAWVAVLEPRGLESPNALKVARRLLPPLAVLQALHAYPVAGLSQVRWGSFLLIPLGAIAIADGARQIAQAMSSEAARGWPWRLAGQVASLALLAIGLRGVLVHMHQERALYESNVPLALPGAGRLRIPEAEAQPLRAVVADLRERCTTHIALPTLGSLYLWAQQEPPTPANNTTWMFLFDAPLQERIVERLRGIDRLCAVQSPGLAEVFTRGRPIPPRPLAVYFASAFTPVAQHGPFTLMVRR
jgi:hypothetical protein